MNLLRNNHTNKAKRMRNIIVFKSTNAIYTGVMRRVPQYRPGTLYTNRALGPSSK